MPALPLSATEAALENQRFGGLQLKVAILCGLTQAFDGYDLNSIGMAAPSLAHAWNVPPAAFASAFVMSSVGIMVGALSAGPVGDRLGRKPVIVTGLLFIGLFSLASAFAASLPILTVLRFFTGIGIGALMPATVALSSDYAPERMRAVVIMLVFVGNPIGGVPRRPVDRADAADLRLAVDLHRRRRAAAGTDPGAIALAAGIATLPAAPQPPDATSATHGPHIEHRTGRRAATRWMSPPAIRSPACSATAWRRPQCWCGYCSSPTC